MLHKTTGIVLRSIRYGDTSLVTTIFTSLHGLQTYMVQGVRSSKLGKNRAGYFQPGTLLELVVYKQPLKNMQRIREFEVAYLYSDLQENVVKNSIVLFSAEVMLRLLPDNAPIPSLFDVAYEYYIALDKMPLTAVANFPLYFILLCSRETGYELKGNYSNHTPYLDLQEGGFTEKMPASLPYTTDDDARALSTLLQVNDYEALQQIELNAQTRLRLIEWCIAFLQLHTQHMGNIRSLAVLQTILH